jgi:hypothetical protein
LETDAEADEGSEADEAHQQGDAHSAQPSSQEILIALACCFANARMRSSWILPNGIWRAWRRN